ncbi:zinc finger CCCH domain-containing protein 37 [Rosa chinensis]|uniref:zinc finger CCCH domain-containing protein 37 n=1 Tax=Rosa chinensis TaxID=74649 RepID=UPI001AD91087|nr:zinc finger CCCH domain-containing protein 37 [Rosa chinensis]
MYLAGTNGLGPYSDAARATSYMMSSWPAPDAEPGPPGFKRTSEALYHQALLGAHNPIGQMEAWYSTNPLAKRPRFENTSLPIYPQRPGETDCAHYMQTRTCKFGEGCKFDHRIWVPDGGIPDWKEVPLVAPSESLPERPGAPDCPYFLKTQRCKFGLRCKFNHPKDKLATACASENGDVYALPETPRGLLNLHFYLKTGQCKYGATCKFNHPKDMIPSATQENKSGETETDLKTEGSEVAVKPLVSFTPALLLLTGGASSAEVHQRRSTADESESAETLFSGALPASEGSQLRFGVQRGFSDDELPVRPGEADCPFYLKTGSCKYGATCQYNHPDRYDINPPVAAISYPLSAPSVAGFNMGVANPAAFTNQTLAQPTVGASPTVYPQRFGQAECEYYMKTGECKYGAQCRFHHPIDRPAVALSTTKPSQQENVKLTLAGLPRREGAVIRVYYLKTGTCKYGATCRFDHPPPGEVVAMAASQAKSDSIGGKA